jgi:hypothetical protein
MRDLLIFVKKIGRKARRRNGMVDATLSGGSPG